MKKRELGIGAVQVLLVIVALVAITAIAVPKYQDFVVRSKMAEAFSIVADTKTKLREFYSVKNRFPRSDTELQSIKTEMFSPPEFVKNVVLKGKTDEHDIVIEVYFFPNVIPGDSINDQFLYVAGDSSSESGVSVNWSCGLVGIEEKYLPDQCMD